MYDPQSIHHGIWDRERQDSEDCGHSVDHFNSINQIRYEQDLKFKSEEKEEKVEE